MKRDSERENVGSDDKWVGLKDKFVRINGESIRHYFDIALFAMNDYVPYDVMT